MEMDEEGLSGACLVGDVAGRRLQQEVLQKLRNDDGGSEGVVEEHVAEEQVHGLLEAPAPPDQQQQADVRRHDEDVDKEEGDKGRNGGGDVQSLY